METILVPITAESVRKALAEFRWLCDPDNDWEQHLPAMEALHETLEAQQRGCDD